MVRTAPEPETLDRLVAEARAGSRTAFGALWEAFAPIVAGYARGRGSQEPEDVTSEVFLAAFSRLPDFAGDGAAFRRWLFTIAHHRVADEARVRARRPAVVGYAPELDPRQAPAAETDALARVGSAEALALLDRLPPDQREVMLLRVVAGLPVADVAVVLDRSPEAVRQLQVRALRRLRTHLPLAEPVTPSDASTIAQV